jgi:hypothetical protein
MTNPDNIDLDIRKQQLLHLVDSFREKIRGGTSNPENFITISEIERFWSELRGDTDALYTDMLCELMAEIDESDILRKKKRNTGVEA